MRKHGINFLFFVILKSWFMEEVTWLHVEMSCPLLRNSSTFSTFPALAALRKLVLLSDCGNNTP